MNLSRFPRRRYTAGPTPMEELAEEVKTAGGHPYIIPGGGAPALYAKHDLFLKARCGRGDQEVFQTYLFAGM